MNKKSNLQLIFFIGVTIIFSANTFCNVSGQEEISKKPVSNQEKITKPDEISDPEKQEKSLQVGDITFFESAINAYRDTVTFYKWVIWLFVAIVTIFGIFIWSRYRNLEQETKRRISDFQKEAEEKLGRLEGQIGNETTRIETAGKIFIGMSLIFQGRVQESIPLLEGVLTTKEILTNEQQIIVHFTLCNIYCDMQNITLASAHSDEAIKLAPNLSYARFLRSRTLQLLGDYYSALKEITLVENLAISENYLPEALATLYTFHGNLLIQTKEFDVAREMFIKAKVLIEERMLQFPFGSPQWIPLSQIKVGVDNSLSNIEVRGLLKEKFDIEPTQDEIMNFASSMRLLPFANKIENVYQIFRDKNFISLLKNVFNEILSRSPETWEILKYGDKWLAKQQEGKELIDMIREELRNSSEFITKKENERKYNKLLE